MVERVLALGHVRWRGLVLINETSEDDPRAYIRLALLVRRQIADGTLAPGQPVPSITRLTQDHGHGRQTCSKALRLLVDNGLLFRVPGLGYYVSKTAIERIVEQLMMDDKGNEARRYARCEHDSAEPNCAWRAVDRIPDGSPPTSRELPELPERAHRHFEEPPTCQDPITIESPRNPFPVSRHIHAMVHEPADVIRLTPAVGENGGEVGNDDRPDHGDGCRYPMSSDIGRRA